MTQTPKTEPIEVIYVDSDVDEVVCNGGGGPLGHPQVWYSFDGQDSVEPNVFIVPTILLFLLDQSL